MTPTKSSSSRKAKRKGKENKIRTSYSNYFKISLPNSPLKPLLIIKEKCKECEGKLQLPICKVCKGTGQTTTEIYALRRA